MRYSIMIMLKRLYFILIPFLALLLVLNSCSVKTISQINEPQTVYEENLRFQEMYLAALRSKFKEAYDDEYLFLSEAQRLRPNAPEVLFELSCLTREKVGAFDSLSLHQSDSLLQRAVVLAPNNVDYRLALVEMLENETKFAEAALQLQYIVQQQPTDENYYNLALNLHISNQPKLALKAIDEWEELCGITRKSTWLRSSIYSTYNEPEKSVDCVQILCNTNPDNLSYKTLLGTTYASVGRYKEAFSCFDSVFTIQPFFPEAVVQYLYFAHRSQKDSLYYDFAHRLLLAPKVSPRLKESVAENVIQVAEQQKEPSRVISIFHDVLQQSELTAGFLQSYLSFLRKRPSEKNEFRLVLEHLLLLEPDDDAIRKELIFSSLKVFETKKMLQLCREGLHRSPNDWLYSMLTAEYLIQMDSCQKSLPLIEKAIRLNRVEGKRALPDLYALKAHNLEKLHRYSEAYMAYDSVLVLNPTDNSVLNNYAYLLAKRRTRLNEAEKMSHTTVIQDPKMACYRDTYAYILYLLGQYEAAYKEIQEAIHLYLIKEDEQISSDIYRHAEAIAKALGKKSEARNFSIKAIELEKVEK